MTDSTDTGAAAAPHIEVVPDLGGSDDFDAQLSQFLNHSMMDGADGDDNSISIEETINAGGNTTAPVVAPDSGSGNVTQVTPVVASTGNTTGAPAADAVDPAAVLEMLGFGKTPAPAPAPAAAATTAPAAATPPAGDDAPFTPFRPDFVLPPEMTAALFESEDSGTRSKALVGLLSSAMNAAVQVVDQRMKEYYAPRLMETFAANQTRQQQQNAFVSDFYAAEGGYPDLAPHGQIVARAIKVLADQNPDIAWAAAKPRVAALARAVIAQATGIAAPVAATAVAATPKKTPPARAQDTAFLAGNARPAGVGDPVDPTSPEALLTDMTAF